MTIDRERWGRWTELARNVAYCETPDLCGPEDHVRSIRFLIAEAFEDGYVAGRKSLRAKP